MTTPPEGAPAIGVRALTVRYAEVTALDDVALTVGSGAICGLVGVNGSGKSTLLKSIVGTVRPSRGTVLVHGRPQELARKAGTIGYLPQSEDVDWAFPLRVWDVVMMGRYGRLGFTRRPRAADRDAVRAALTQVELDDLAHRQIGALSGGQRKRAFLARAIAQDATVLLLDEPFAGVDARSAATITGLLRQLAATGRTILVATHDLPAVPELCTEAVLLLRRVLAHGPPAEVLQPSVLARAFGMEPS